MKSRLTLYGTIVVLGTVLAACASTTPTPAAVATQASAPVVTQAPAPVVTQAVAAPATQPAAMAGAIAVADSAKGKILVDGNGMTLYIYTKDSANVSNCSGGCAEAWPALAAVPTAGIGAGVDATLLGSITRADGSSQATYKGMPLYTYSKDTKPGDLNGQGKGGVWYVISPAGAIINP